MGAAPSNENENCRPYKYARRARRRVSTTPNIIPQNKAARRFNIRSRHQNHHDRTRGDLRRWRQRLGRLNESLSTSENHRRRRIRFLQKAPGGGANAKARHRAAAAILAVPATRPA